MTSDFGARTTSLGAVSALSLKRRNAIVTGGASGLGLATSRALASAGASVTLAVRNQGHDRSACVVLTKPGGCQGGQSRSMGALIAVSARLNARLNPLEQPDRSP